MRILVPIEYNDAQLLSTNIAEIYSAYSSVTTYAKDDRVDFGIHIYQSLVNSNTNNQPDISPTKWLLVGPDNKHALFDLQVSTQTTNPTSISLTMVPGKRWSSLAGINVNASQVSLLVKDTTGGSTIYNETKQLNNTVVLDWYDYFFEEFILLDEFLFEGIPPYVGSEFTLTLSGLTTIGIGYLLYGTLSELGDTQYGLSTGIRDYSVKNTDEFGTTTFVQRGFSKRFEAQLMFNNANISAVLTKLQLIRATPVLWLPTNNINGLNTFGYYREFDININYPNHSLCSLQVEGLT